jgi:hypothetical protein
MTRDDIAQYEDAWRERGYWLEEVDGKPVVEGNCSEFAYEVVSGYHDAPKLMAYLRDANPEEYARYREDARDDDIDLDYTLDMYVKGPAAAGYR